MDVVRRIHASPAEAQAFFAKFDPRMEALSVTWHTFDLDEIDSQTAAALDMIKTERVEIRRRGKIPAIQAPLGIPEGKEAP